MTSTNPYTHTPSPNNDRAFTARIRTIYEQPYCSASPAVFDPPFPRTCVCFNCSATVMYIAPQRRSSFLNCSRVSFRAFRIDLQWFLYNQLKTLFHYLGYSIHISVCIAIFRRIEAFSHTYEIPREKEPERSSLHALFIPAYKLFSNCLSPATRLKIHHCRCCVSSLIYPSHFSLNLPGESKIYTFFRGAAADTRTGYRILNEEERWGLI